MTKRAFNHEFKIRLYGKRSQKMTIIDYIYIPYYDVVYGAQVPGKGKLFDSMNETIDAIVKKFFNLDFVGVGFAAFFDIPTANHLISACNDGQDLILIMRQFDAHAAGNGNEVQHSKDLSANQIKFIASREHNSYDIKAYTVTDQFKFLF